MITEIVMPKMGESINEGTILEWRKKVGDTIELDEILLEIGTDKVDSEIPSPCEGVIVEILAKPNDVIEVGKVIAKIDSENTLLWHRKPSRLEAEAIRDRMLDVAGVLNKQMFGPSIPIGNYKETFEDLPQSWRRSI